MVSEIQEIEQLIREADSVDANRTRLIRERFLELLPLVRDPATAQELLVSFVMAHTSFEAEIARGAFPDLTEARRADCLAVLAQIEREIGQLTAN